jgi:hypothetical protein
MFPGNFGRLFRPLLRHGKWNNSRTAAVGWMVALNFQNLPPRRPQASAEILRQDGSRWELGQVTAGRASGLLLNSVKAHERRKSQTLAG